MLPVLVVLLPGGDDDIRSMSLSSARLAVGGTSGFVVTPDVGGIMGVVSDTPAELIHFINPGTIVLPHAYRAVSTWIEDSKRDFILFGLLLAGKEITSLIDGDQIAASRMVVRTWVAKEFGFPKEGADAFAAGVTSEYRGVEIPHVLCVEIPA